MLGELGEDTKQQILSYLNEPTKAHWDAIACMCIKGGVTLWQLWVQFDTNAPRSLPGTTNPNRWPRIPDVEALRCALVEIGQSARLRSPKNTGLLLCRSM